MYKLIAQNEQGASVEFNAVSMTECLRNFDSEYTRSGFVIKIYLNLTGKCVKTIKRSFR